MHVSLLQCTMADAASHGCTGKHSPWRQGRDVVARPLTAKGQWQEAMRPTLQPCDHSRCNCYTLPTLLRKQAVYCACLVFMASVALLIRQSRIMPSLT